ncbi:CoA transferase [Streptomyces daliensis]|uniref:CoA transferase n=1 Tax=Streptomyces daliensis TaxID=299421 RepID=A0A8T4IM48_9ACTN|nr:CoA transferase [Streptomyces daliensis]
MSETGSTDAAPEAPLTTPVPVPVPAPAGPAQPEPPVPARTDDATAHAWAALGGDPALLDRVSLVRRPRLLPSRLPVLELARSTVAVCSLAAAELASVRAHGTGGTGETGGTSGADGEGPEAADVPSVRVDDGAVATAFVSERQLRVDGREPANFAPLSRFWRTADGWLRTHANYPHHRARLLTALGLQDGAEEATAETTERATEAALAERVAAVLAERKAVEVETEVYAAGGLAVAVRTPHDWARHPQGAALTRQPLLSAKRLDRAPVLPFAAPCATSGDGAQGPSGRPLDGVRVLDLTRVIAGPVASRTLALLGANVLRIDAPQLPERRDAHADSGFGKRSALLDLSDRAGQATFEELLSSAHVVLTGYRPGALDRFGLAPESLADRRPGLVVGQLSAWGAHGPWHRRRGFDSLVQAASGIAAVEAGPDGAPGVLPAQALDHGSGYLLAAAVLRSLTEQRRGASGSRVVRLALARTASWLLGDAAHTSGTGSGTGSGAEAAGTHGPAHDPSPWLSECSGPLGRLRYALSPVGYEGGPADWSRPPGEPGTDAPAWH